MSKKKWPMLAKFKYQCAIVIKAIQTCVTCFIYFSMCWKETLLFGPLYSISFWLLNVVFSAQISTFKCHSYLESLVIWKVWKNLVVHWDFSGSRSKGISKFRSPVDSYIFTGQIFFFPSYGARNKSSLVSNKFKVEHHSISSMTLMFFNRNDSMQCNLVIFFCYNL